MLMEVKNDLVAGGTIMDDDTLGGRICKAREVLELSTAQLARRLGVNTQTVQAWEQDQDEPRSNRLVMLAGVLNVSPSWLLIGAGESPSDTLKQTDVEGILEALRTLRNQSQATTDELERIIERVESLGHYTTQS